MHTVVILMKRLHMGGICIFTMSHTFACSFIVAYFYLGLSEQGEKKEEVHEVI